MPRWPKDHKKKMSSRAIPANRCLECCLREQKERFDIIRKLGKFYLEELARLEMWYTWKLLEVIPVGLLATPIFHAGASAVLPPTALIGDNTNIKQIAAPDPTTGKARPFPGDASFIDENRFKNSKRVNFLVKTKRFPTFEIKRYVIERGRQVVHQIAKKLEVIELVLEPMSIMERFLEEIEELQAQVDFNCKECIEDNLLPQKNNGVQLDACDWISLRKLPSPAKLLVDGAEPPCEVMVQAGLKRRIRNDDLKSIQETMKEFNELPTVEELASGLTIDGE